MSNKIFIVHFHPISLYPPVKNLINFLLEKGEELKVYTSSVDLPRENFYNNNVNLEIKYLFKRKKIGGIKNTLKLIYFNIHTLFAIISHKPQSIIYYESLSALPAIIYKNYFNKNVKIICHYHEISSNETIHNEARSVKLIRNIEKKQYKNFSWISQTNEFRKAIFINDYKKYLDHNIVHSLANYPPKKWISKKKSNKRNDKVRFVLVGSIDVHSMYLAEFCNILERQKFDFKLDIYTFQIDELTKTFIQSKDYLNIKNFVLYETIPDVLKNYDVGVILYKPLSINITNCASNKLFEYHVCGLDIVFPSSMTYSKNYITEGTFPIIKEIDFENAKDVDLSKLFEKSTLKFKQLPVTAEYEYERLYNILK